VSLFMHRSLLATAMCASITAACEDPGLAVESSVGSQEDATGLQDAGTGPASPMPAAVARLLEEKCQACHARGATAQPIFGSVDDVWAQLDRVIAVSESGEMPPWQPDRDCSTFWGDPRVSEAELTSLRSWRDGVVEPTGGASPTSLVERPPDVVSSRHRLVAEPARGVDYLSCVALEERFAATVGSLTAFRIVTLLPEVTHHFVLGILEADAAQSMPTAGGEVSCETDWKRVGAQIDLRRPESLPDDLAISLEGGRRLLLQVHVNTYEVAGPVGSPFDVWLEGWTRPGDAPGVNLSFQSVENRDFMLPAGASSTIVTARHSINPGTILGIVPHMHLRGRSFSAWLHRPGQEPVCLVRIPGWDFWSQRQYYLNAEQRFHVGPDDEIEVRCEFDNSAAAQPHVQGVRIEPRDVRYGSTGLDEMCELGVIHVQGR
jgi:cytochrome c5